MDMAPLIRKQFTVFRSSLRRRSLHPRQAHIGSPAESHSGGSSATSEFKNDEEVEDYGVVSFLPIEEKKNSGLYNMNMLCPPFPVLLQGINKISSFGQSQKKYYPLIIYLEFSRLVRGNSRKSGWIRVWMVTRLCQEGKIHQ